MANYSFQGERALDSPALRVELQPLMRLVYMWMGFGLLVTAFAKVPIFVFMGDQDTNDSLQFGDGYDPEDKDLVELVYGATPAERWDDAVKIHQAAGSKATFKLYPGVGHETTGEMEKDVEEFLRGVLAEAGARGASGD